jgi:metal-responsive CopG/Arc/MetJ family transcriptional regulator
MATFTSSLPDELLKELADTAKRLKLPKNKLIEKALSMYLKELDRAAYAKSYRRMANDTEMLAIAEEGIEDWFHNIDEIDKQD